MTSSCLQNEYHLGDLIFPSLIISVGYNLSHFWAKYWSDDPEEQLLRIFCLNDVGLLLIIAVSSASIYKYQLFQLSRAFTLVSFQTSNYIIKCLLFLLDILIIFCLRKWVCLCLLLQFSDSGAWWPVSIGGAFDTNWVPSLEPMVEGEKSPFKLPFYV